MCVWDVCVCVWFSLWWKWSWLICVCDVCVCLCGVCCEGWRGSGRRESALVGMSVYCDAYSWKVGSALWEDCGCWASSRGLCSEAVSASG